MKTILLIFFLMFISFAQTNLILKPSQVIKLTWNASSEADVWQYAIYYCQGSDTTIFPIKTGVDPDTLFKGELVSNWNYATVYDLKFCLEPKTMTGTTYLRLGVSAINSAGKQGLIKCISKVITIRKPIPVINVKIN